MPRGKNQKTMALFSDTRPSSSGRKVDKPEGRKTAKVRSRRVLRERNSSACELQKMQRVVMNINTGFWYMFLLLLLLLLLFQLTRHLTDVSCLDCKETVFQPLCVLVSSMASLLNWP